MKKIIKCFLSLVLFIGLTACGSFAPKKQSVTLGSITFEIPADWKIYDEVQNADGAIIHWIEVKSVKDGEENVEFRIMYHSAMDGGPYPGILYSQFIGSFAQTLTNSQPIEIVNSYSTGEYIVKYNGPLEDELGFYIVCLNCDDEMNMETYGFNFTVPKLDDELVNEIIKSISY